ncbi:MAG: monovalent cation/H+ antiporter complex subunit F [Acidimicrobiia bacterium]|nr:monovalent cation/H+ antiporter complex subunit F [Acidimicrobiia bacterium]
MSAVAAVATASLVVAAVLVLYRLLSGPTLADRMVALDALLVLITSGIAVNAAATGSGEFLDVMIVVSLIGFVGSVTVARFIEKRGP